MFCVLLGVILCVVLATCLKPLLASEQKNGVVPMVIVEASSHYPALSGWKDVPSLPQLLSHLASNEWHSFIVGGWVRDAVLGNRAKDIDIECYSEREREIDELELCLKQVVNRVTRAGVSFGVLKVYLPGFQHPIDVSLPRREKKTGRGHRGFSITYDARISPREASSRRDFTFNALMYDPLHDTLYDFWGGIRDLQAGVLRHISRAFVEDPLRVLRGFRFCSRFGLSPAPETVEMCKQLRGEFSALARERVGNEFLLWASANLKQPSAGLMFLQETGWGELFPPFAKMMKTRCASNVQRENLWKCAAMGADVLSGLLAAEGIEKREHLMLAILSFGMCVEDSYLCTGCTETDVMTIRERISRLSPRISDFWSSMGISKKLADRTARLCCAVSALPLTPADVRVLSSVLEPATVKDWYILARSVYSPFPKRLSKIGDAYNMAKEEGVTDSPPPPLITGGMLLQLGFREGPQIGTILRNAYWAQLLGAFSSPHEAVQWLLRETSTDWTTCGGERRWSWCSRRRCGVP